jgi:hypothetical protein
MFNEHLEEEELLSKDDSNSDQNDIFKDSTKISKKKQNIGNFSSYSSKVNWVVFFFICIFTMGSWLDISGIWCEVEIF